MKKILKIVVVIIILVTLLSGNASVLAKASVDMLSESKTKINTIENETKIPENSVNEQTDEIQNNDNKNQTLTSEKSTEETEANENTEKIVEENKEKENKTSSNNEVVLFSNMEKNETKNGSVAKTNTQLGKLWIEINLRLPQIEQNLKVTIKKSDKFVKEFTAPTEEAPKTNLAGDENGEEYYTSLYYISDDLEPGNDYSIEITGKYYIAYTQNEIEIKENNETKIKLTNGHYSDNMLNGLGVIALGDVNLDNKIDELDIKEMVEQIESANPNSDYDLNGDGEVNIVDLSYIAINKNEGDLEASTTSKIKVDNNKVSKDMTKGSIVSDGNTTLNDILEDNGKAVTFAPNDPEKEISASNPIEITLDLGDEILTETGAITISPSTNRENNIISGVVTIETADSKIIEAEITTKTVAKKYNKITSRAGSLRNSNYSINTS